MIPASKRIASFAVQFCDKPLSAAQRHIVYRAFLDTFAVAVAGRNDDAPRIARIKAHESTGALLPRWAEAKLQLKNGGTLEERITTSRGDAQNPLSDDELTEKAEDCFSYGGVDWSAKSFTAEVFALSNSRVDDVIRRCTGNKLGNT